MKARAKKEPGALSRLLGKRTAKRFLEKHWPHETLCVHGSRTRLRGLVDIPELQSVEALASCPAERVMVQNDDRDLVTASPEEAVELYQWGYQLYLDGIEPRTPSFEKWLRELEVDLGLPRGRVRCNAFACQRGSTAGPSLHFDYAEGFTVQVRGTKRWRLVENQHVRYPNFAYMLGEEVDSEHRHFFPHGAPKRLPVGKTVLMKPGSVMFLPRGAWHAATPVGESLHLDIDVDVPTWASVALSALERDLWRREHWRKPIETQSGRALDEAEERMGELLEELRDVVSEVDAARTLRNAGLRTSRRR